VARDLGAGNEREFKLTHDRLQSLREEREPMRSRGG
jgi:hypothetical protein